LRIRKNTSKELAQTKAIVKKRGIEKTDSSWRITMTRPKRPSTRRSSVAIFCTTSQKHDLKVRYKRYRKQEMEKVRMMLNGETLPSMATAIREDLTHEETFPAMIGMGVSMRIEAALEERAGVLPYEEWRAQQG
jgi:hypothetical protein